MVRPSRRRLLPALLACTALLAVAPAAPADAATRRCASADLRYPFTPGGPKTFGVFRLQVTGSTCATAHRVAKKWMDAFEDGLTAGRVRLRRTVDGYRFTTLRPNAAQTYRLRGRRGDSTIRFDYVVPNG